MSEREFDFDELVDRCTARFKRDRELRMELANELESHLTASAAEYEAADYSEDDALNAAEKAFGDPDAVAEGLWEANRFRLSLRAWGWWAARLTLLPACVLATWLLVIPGLSPPSGAAGLESASGLGTARSRSVEARMKSEMTPSQQLIFYGDESADNAVDRRRAVRDAYPDDARYQLELIATMLSDLPERPEGQPELYAARRAALVQELERGAAMDPDNGVYAIIRSALALDAGALLDDAPAAGVVVSVLDRKGTNGERVDSEVSRLKPDADPAVVAEGLRWLEVASGKPYVSMHVSDRVRDRLAQLPPARSMSEYVMRVGADINTLLPTLGRARDVARVAVAEGLRRAEAGDIDGAILLLDEVDGLSSRLAVSSDTVVSLLMAWSIKSTGSVARVAVFRAVGDDRQAAALAQSDALMRYWADDWHGASEPVAEERALQTSGLLMSTIYPALPGYHVDTTPFRKAEYTLVDRGVLMLGLGVLIALSALSSLVGVWGVWRRRKPATSDTERPLLLTIGVRVWAVVIGGAVLLPVLGFVLWSATPWSGRGYGLNYSWAALVWYFPVMFAVLVLLWRMGVSALWHRAREIGLAVPTRRGWVRDAILAVALLGLACGLWAWVYARRYRAGSISSVEVAASLSLIGLVGLVVVVWMGGELWWMLRRNRWFARSVLRSMAPVWAAAGLTLALGVGSGLNLRERALARQMMATSPSWLDMEVERSNAKALRTWLAGDAVRPPRLR